MKNLKEKLRKNGGFTLVEMLIVVAIIAILIAVSIPMVGSALERSRHAVDAANNRDALSLASIEYLTNDDISKNDTNTILKYYVNDSHQGKLIADADKDKDENKGYKVVTPSCTCSGHIEDELTVTITKDGNASTNWEFDNEGATKKPAAGNNDGNS